MNEVPDFLICNAVRNIVYKGVCTDESSIETINWIKKNWKSIGKRSRFAIKYDLSNDSLKRYTNLVKDLDKIDEE